jgi:hypothetical protein
MLEIQHDELDELVQKLVRNIGIVTFILIIIYHILVAKASYKDEQ